MDLNLFRNQTNVCFTNPESIHHVNSYPNDNKSKAEEWSCTACTFINYGGSQCQICQTPKPQQHHHDENTSNWSCPACTFENNGNVSLCQICDTQKPKATLTKQRKLSSSVSIENCHHLKRMLFGLRYYESLHLDTNLHDQLTQG